MKTFLVKNDQEFVEKVIGVVDCWDDVDNIAGYDFGFRLTWSDDERIANLQLDSLENECKFAHGLTFEKLEENNFPTSYPCLLLYSQDFKYESILHFEGYVYPSDFT